MNNKAFFILLGFLSLGFTSYAATGLASDSKYGNGEDSVRCLENLSLYQNYYKIKDYDASFEAWQVVYAECPKAGGRTLYSKGAFMIANKMIAEKDVEKKKALFQQLMACYEQRVKYFGADRKYPEAWIRGRQAIDYIAYSGDKDLQKNALPWLKLAMETRKDKADADVMNAYFTLLTKQYKQDKEGKKDAYIADYIQVGKWLDVSVNSGGKYAANYALVKNNVDKMFTNSGAADCATLESVFVNKVEENKANFDELSTVIRLFRSAGCKESNVYFTASQYAHSLKPTAETAAGCAFQSFQKEDYKKALTFFSEAVELETVDSLKYDLQSKVALCYFKLGKAYYPQARTAARKAIAFDGTQGAPYILIATMYASTDLYPDDKILSKTVYWAAAEQLRKAISVSPSSRAKAQALLNNYKSNFPTKENVFFHNKLQPGSTFKVGGWIGETVNVRD